MSLFINDHSIPMWENGAAGENELSGIHVWKAKLLDWVGEEERFYSWLSEEEKTRLQRIRFDYLRQRFTISHGAVREILGSYIRLPPQALEFEALPSGKPFLSGKSLSNNPGLRFNYSHSENLLVLAVSWEFELGVDVELIKPEIEHAAISKHFFASNEMSLLQAAAPEQQVNAFYQLWTCKEAVLKAHGSGLRQRLDTVKIEFKAGEKIGRGWLAADQYGSQPWAVQTFSPEPGYVTALAYNLDASAEVLPKLKFWRLTR